MNKTRDSEDEGGTYEVTMLAIRRGARRVNAGLRRNVVFVTDSRAASDHFSDRIYDRICVCASYGDGGEQRTNRLANLRGCQLSDGRPFHVADVD